MIGTPIVNLADILAVEKEKELQAMIDEFSCPYNMDVENFLKSKAVEFSKQQLAATYFVFKQYKGNNVVAGYFSIAQKHFHIDLNKKGISKSMKKRISKYAQRDDDLKKYVANAMLLGQLGKNFANGYNNLITGDELLSIACERIADIQRVSSGKLVYAECEDTPRLIEFYGRNGFFQFGTRLLDRDETDLKGKYLVQLFKYL